MIPISLANQDWQAIVDRLGGAKAIGTLARQTRACLDSVQKVLQNRLSAT
jgi:hypothetical protein